MGLQQRIARARRPDPLDGDARPALAAYGDTPAPFPPVPVSDVFMAPEAFLV